MSITRPYISTTSGTALSPSSVRPVDIDKASVTVGVPGWPPDFGILGAVEREAAFTAAVEPHRRELRVHCYRMTGSFVESEDLLQETLLRAWRGWSEFHGRSSVRTWLYRIATNVCLDYLKGRPRRVLPFDVTEPAPGTPAAASAGPLPWLEPIPDGVLAPQPEHDPSEYVIRREAITLAFLAALQVLSPQQRAALILRDVLGMPADEAADVLAISVAAVKSALQRARAALREAIPASRLSWSADPATTEQERRIVARYVAALENRDGRAMAELLHEDLRVAYLPRDLRIEGRDAFIDGSRRYAPAGEFRYVPVGANLQPAIAVYLRPPGEAEFRRLSLAVVRIRNERIEELLDFSDPSVLDAFGIPLTQ